MTFQVSRERARAERYLAILIDELSVTPQQVYAAVRVLRDDWGEWRHNVTPKALVEHWTFAAMKLAERHRALDEDDPNGAMPTWGFFDEVRDAA